jgi:hypothetical protein
MLDVTAVSAKGDESAAQQQPATDKLEVSTMAGCLEASFYCSKQPDAGQHTDKQTSASTPLPELPYVSWPCPLRIDGHHAVACLQRPA